MCIYVVCKLHNSVLKSVYRHFGVTGQYNLSLGEVIEDFMWKYSYWICFDLTHMFNTVFLNPRYLYIPKGRPV